jgi:hypothetical protein
LSRPRTPIRLAVIAAFALASGAAGGQEPPGRTRATPPTGAASETAPGAAGKTERKDDGPPLVSGTGEDSPKRALPDYDGRGAPRTTAADVALWIPRILLSPLYFVSEYLVRRPLGWFIATAERKQWPSVFVNLFTFGPDKKAGVVPTAFLDFGFRSSFGVYAFWDDLLGPGNHLRLQASTFGVGWLQGSVADRFPVGEGATLDLRLEGIHRPDQLFHGLGPSASHRDRGRYGIDSLRARPVLEIALWRSSRLMVEGGAKTVGFREDSCCDDPSIEIRAREGRYALPPAYTTGYTSVYQRAEVRLDSREERPRSQSGYRLELEVEQAADVRRADSNWIRYGGSVGGFLDIKNNRTLSVSVTALFVDPLSRGAVIPFTEQIVLGGDGLMRGYLFGRLVDRSAAIATMKYRWPIWVFLDGTIQGSLGNVFGPQLEGFRPSLLRLSSAIGVESVGAPDSTFEVLAGLGTETFEDNLNVTSVRLVFGTNRGF